MSKMLLIFSAFDSIAHTTHKMEKSTIKYSQFVQMRCRFLCLLRPEIHCTCNEFWNLTKSIYGGFSGLAIPKN